MFDRLLVTFGRLLFVSATLSTAMLRPAAAVQNTCVALASNGRDIFFVRNDGSIITQLKAHEVRKDSLGLSPDAQRITYLTPTEPYTLHIRSLSGEDASFRQQDLKVPFIDAAWGDNTTIRVEEHVSPKVSRYSFFSLSERAPPHTILSPLGHAVGETCVIASAGGDIACVRDNTITVNDRPVYSVNPLEGARQIESIDTSVGRAAQTRVPAGFSILAVSIDNGISLRIIYPNGYWSETIVGAGGFDSITYHDVEYIVRPRILDRSRNLVRITIAQGPSHFVISAITWTPDGSDDAGLLFAQQSNGKRSLVLVRPSHSTSSVIRKPEWLKAGQVGLAVNDDILSMRFETRTRLAYKSLNGFGALILDLPNSDLAGRPSSPLVTTAETRPVSIPITTREGNRVNAHICDWACP
jgi:hypothetical protein